MGAWIDVLLVTLALGAGWTGWVLLRVAQASAQVRRQSWRRPAPARPAALTVVKAQAVDSEL